MQLLDDGVIPMRKAVKAQSEDELDIGLHVAWKVSVDSWSC